VTSGPAADGIQRRRRAGIDVVLLDIEGTTTPITFVHDVLFPYSRARLGAWFDARSPSDPQVREIVHALQREDTTQRADPSIDEVVAHLSDALDRDRKSPALKMVQGLIWEQGYASGELRSVVYDDVPPALQRWTSEGIAAGIYSSGSVLAQKLLFAHSNAGDLTPWLRWHFDTAMGAKVDAASYRRIIDALRVNPSAVLFVSDVPRELEAARDAGLKTALCVRPPASPPATGFAVIRTIDEIDRISFAASHSDVSC
jgi:2,3-diketo-5-methylthio-1-phosphopentane phosphatase